MGNYFLDILYKDAAANILEIIKGFKNIAYL